MPEKKYEKVCVCCGKIFHASSGAAKYCSDECRESMAWERARQKNKIHTCPQCGKQFLRDGTFCSRDCYYAALKAGWRKSRAVRGTAGAVNETADAVPGTEDPAPVPGQMQEAPVQEVNIIFQPETTVEKAVEKPEEWGVRPADLSGFRQPTEEEKAMAAESMAVNGGLCAYLGFLSAAVSMGFFSIFSAAEAPAAGITGCIISILAAWALSREAGLRAGMRRMIRDGQFEAAECRADYIYPHRDGERSVPVLVYNKTRQYCSRVFHISRRSAAYLRCHPDAPLVLARAKTGKRCYYHLYLNK